MKSYSLRQKLQEITDDRSLSRKEQKVKIISLKSKYNHRIIKLENKYDIPFNCFAYALDVVESKKIISILREYQDYRDCKFGIKFIQRLLHNKILENLILIPAA